MILDIRYSDDTAPVQIQHIRMATVYPHYDRSMVPEIVIHSYNPSTPQRNIELSTIRSISITND